MKCNIITFLTRQPNPSQVVQGAYKYVSPEGTSFEVSYTADEEGFKPQASSQYFQFYNTKINLPRNLVIKFLRPSMLSILKS